MRELVPESLYSTYEKRYDLKDGSGRDLEVAKQLAEHLGLHHHGYSLEAPAVPYRRRSLA
ncbi:hypothetical protein [Georgenia sp. AZ-5]|uniref:hypothetical protein n=1 Tax=Georgenia sp. AZ-5 TaxID=3367526 RepID=UPI00375419E1